MTTEEKVLVKLRALFPNNSIEVGEIIIDSNTFVRYRQFILDGVLTKKFRLPVFSEDEWNSHYSGILMRDEMMYILYQELNIALGLWRYCRLDEDVLAFNVIVQQDGSEIVYPEGLTVL